MTARGSLALDELRRQLEEIWRHLLQNPIPARVGCDLDEVDAALARLAAATFGMCERCGRPILLARLRVIPTLRVCLACEAEATHC